MPEHEPGRPNDAARGGPTEAADTPVSGDIGRTRPFTEGLATEAMPLPAPVRIGRFEILGLLGEGGFGQVFRARDPSLDREVALKVPRPGVLASPVDRERFLREARAAATLHHPNLCPVHEVGQAGDRDYIVMAYVAGKSLASILKERKERFPARQVIAMVRQLALALDAAHQKGIIHRDLKPANILYDAERKELVVTDFGLARRAKAGEAELTHSGVIMGTPAYMAPEQARGDTKAVGPAADVYSLGVILYELLTGRKPFTGPIGEVIGKVLHVEPESPSKVRPDVDPRLEAVCLKAMTKDPAGRYATMREFAAALADCAKGPGTANPAPVASPSPFADLSDTPKLKTVTVVPAAERSRWRLRAAVVLAVVAAVVAVPISVRFFARPLTASVELTVDPEDLKNESLRFELDGQPISAESLRKEVEIAFGDHELVFISGPDVVKRMLFSVQGKPPSIKFKDVQIPVPPLEPGFVSLFNGKDLSGWLVATGDPGAWAVRDGVLNTGKAGAGRESWLLTTKDYANFILRFDFQFDPGAGSGGVMVRLSPTEGEFLPIKVMNDDARGKGAIETGEFTGTLWVRDRANKLRASPLKRPAKLAAAGGWNTAELTLNGRLLTFAVNGEVIQALDLADYAKQVGNYPPLTRSTGRIGFQGRNSPVRYRRIAVKELGSAAVSP